jgi:flagellar biosynthesis chaperone FliJ
MKRPEFKLESYLNVCRSRQELEEVRMGELTREEMGLESSMKDCAARINQTIEEKSRLEDGEILVREILLYQQYLATLRDQASRLKDRKDALNVKVEEQRKQLMSAMRMQKVVSKLKERSKKLHLKKADRSLQEEVDELYLLQFGRSKKPRL